eukprot:gene17477-19224_t
MTTSCCNKYNTTICNVLPNSHLQIKAKLFKTVFIGDQGAMLQNMIQNVKTAFAVISRFLEGINVVKMSKEVKMKDVSSSKKDDHDSHTDNTRKSDVNKNGSNESKFARRKKLFIAHGTSPYFWPDAETMDIEMMLKDQPEGAFLIREGNHKDSKLDLTYLIDGHVTNMKIDFDSERKLFSLDLSNAHFPNFGSLEAFATFMIEKCKDHSLMVVGGRDGCKKNTGLVKMKHAVKRNITLMDHCKNAIYRDFPEEMDYHVHLDIPRHLKDFLAN